MLLLAWALTLVCAATAGAVGPTVDAPLTVQRAAITPITPASPCSIEPEAPEYINVGWSPFPHVQWFGSTLIPSADDMTADLRAGANSDVCLGFSLPVDAASPNMSNWRSLSDDIPVNPQTDAASGDDMRDITIDLPRGFAANLTNVETCTTEQFGYDVFDPDAAPIPRNPAFNPARCPATSLVGDAMARMSTTLYNIHTLIGGSYVTAGATPAEDGDEFGAIWKLPAGPNELGRLGVQLYPAGLGSVKPTKFTVRLTLAPDGSGRVRALVKDAPRRHLISGNQNLYVEGIWMRMWGAESDHPDTVWEDPEYGGTFRAQALNGDFMETPTDCSTAGSARVDVTTYGGPLSADPSTWTPSRSAIDSPGVQMTGCDQLPFSPSVQLTTAERAPAVPTAATLRVAFDQTPAGGRLPALPKEIAVTLPAGLEVGAQVASGAGGLPLCSAAQFAAADTSAPAACPAGSAAATVQIDTPLIELPFTGVAYLGEQGAIGELPDLYLEATLDGATAADAPRVKLIGEVSVGAGGEVTARFRELPQLRFSAVTLNFPGGPNALLVTPRQCGTSSGVSQISPWSGQPASLVTTELTIDEDCDAAGVTSLAIAPASPQAGAKAPTAVTLTRSSDRAPLMAGLQVAMPPGLLADLNVAAECPLATAQAGECGAASKIATVHAKAGVGDEPLQLTGAMHLVEREAGRVAGASIVVRAVIGEIDLGNVIVGAQIDLRPTDAGLTLTTQVPERFRGLALNLREVTVDLDRPGFALNPSACGPLPAAAILTAASGAAQTATAEVSYSGCAQLPFAPSISAQVSGEPQAGGHPSVVVEIAARPGDGNLRATAVTLPGGLSTDLKNVQTRCSPAQFVAAACSPATRVGAVAATVSITPEQVPGDVFLVDVPGETLPGLGLSFTGRYAQRVSSTVRFRGDRLQVTFPAIPDLPLTKLTMAVDGGARGPLLRNAKCAAPQTSWDAVFTAQGGQTHAASQPAPCAGAQQLAAKAKAKARLRLSRKTGLRLSVSALSGRRLQSLKLTAPGNHRFNVASLRLKGRTKAVLPGSAVKTRATRGSVTVLAAGTAGASGATLRLDRRGSTATSGARPKRGVKLRFRLRLGFTNGDVETSTITVTAPR